MAKISDAELGARTRAGNVRRTAQQRERLAAAGMVQLVTWISRTTKAALLDEAARRGLPVGQTAAELLREALNSHTPAERLAAIRDAASRNETTATPAPDKAGLMHQVAAMLDRGLSGAEVARQLNASGGRTASGAFFTSQNLLRGYRAWLKNGAAHEIHKPPAD